MSRRRRGRHRRPSSHPVLSAAPNAAVVLALACLTTAAVGGVEAGSASAGSPSSLPARAAAGVVNPDLRQVPVDATRDPAAEQRAIDAAEAAEAARQQAEQQAAARLAERQAAAERAAREAAARRLVLPVAHYTLTARFHQRSGLWASGSHTGLDFAAPTGTPVRAVQAGVVISAGWDGPYGNKIVVRHADGTTTWYCHLSAFVVTGGAVQAGQVIGKVGSTGNTTGPHLHLEVHPGGGPAVDPYAWLVAHGLHP